MNVKNSSGIFSVTHKSQSEQMVAFSSQLLLMEFILQIRILCFCGFLYFKIMRLGTM